LSVILKTVQDRDMITTYH